MAGSGGRREEVVLLFPGQGAQYVGMGRRLAEAFESARARFLRADRILGFPLSRLCFEGPEDKLRLTSQTQPAIYVHSLAAWDALQAAGFDLPVGAAAGHSLGEWSALTATGAVTFEDGLRLVRRRGELMDAAGQARAGSMAALLGASEEVAEAVCQEAQGDGVVQPANFNAPGQVAISGDVAAVERAVTVARSRGVRRVIPLEVSGAFHSPLMASAKTGLGEMLERTSMRELAFPVVSNVTAEPVGDPARMRELLVEQLTAPVRWDASMRTLLGQGFRIFIELGPGQVLSGLLRRIDREVGVYHVEDPQSLEVTLRGLE